MKKRSFRVFAAILAIAPIFVFCFSISTIAAFAATATGSQDGLTASVTTDKTGYNNGDTANISVSVSNGNSSDVSGVRLSLALPPGLTRSSGQTQVTVGTLAAGEMKSYELTALAAPATPAAKTTSASASATGIPQTGDNFNPGLWLTLLLISAAALAAVFAFGRIKRGRRVAKTLSLFLCFTLALAFIAPPAAAHAATTQRSFNVSQPVTVAGKSGTVTLTVSYDFQLALVDQAPLSIVDAPAEIPYGSAPFTLTTAGGSGTGAVTWSSDNPDAISIDSDTGEASIVDIGTATITATKAADSDYNAATATATIDVVASFELTYDANGGSGAPASVYTDTSGTAKITPDDGGGMTNDSLTFVGWNTKADGSGTWYGPGLGNLITVTGNITLYAMWSGDGSSDASPLLVYSYDTLYGVRNNLHAHYKVVRDINLSYYAWAPIGDSSTGNDATCFTGVFDGNGHTVSIVGFGTIKPSNTGASDVGLFGYLSSGGVIKNLRVDGTLSCTASLLYIGGIAGVNYGGTVQNCVVTATVTGISSAPYVGGVLGYQISGTTQNCYTTGDVSAVNTSGSPDVGGIVGMNMNGGTIIACYATGSVQADAQDGFNVGGIVGNNSISGRVNNCIALNASITGTGSSPSVGRIAGYNNAMLGGAILTNNYAIDISGLPNGNSGDLNGATITTAQATSQAAYQSGGANFAFGTTDASPWVWGPDAGFSSYPLPMLYWQTTAPACPAFVMLGLANAEAMKITGFAAGTNTTSILGTTNNSTLVFNPIFSSALASGATVNLVGVQAGASAGAATDLSGASVTAAGALSLNTQNTVDAADLSYFSITYTVTWGGVTSDPVTLNLSSLFEAGTTVDKLRTDKAKFTGGTSYTVGSEGTMGSFVVSGPSITLSPGVSVPSTAAYGGDFSIPFNSITVFASDGGSLMVNYSVAQTESPKNIAAFHIPITCAGTVYIKDYSIFSTS